MTIRYAYRNTVYTHPELPESDLQKAREELAAVTNQPSFQVAPIQPRKLCPTCKGIPFVSGPHAGSCPECKGFKRVDMTVDEMREEYRRLRDVYCKRTNIDKEEYDQLVTKEVAKRGDILKSQPGDWIFAARRIRIE